MFSKPLEWDGHLIEKVFGLMPTTTQKKKQKLNLFLSRKQAGMGGHIRLMSTKVTLLGMLNTLVYMMIMICQ